MLLLDLSGIVINAVQGAIAQKEILSESLVRHVALSQILHYKKKYSKYGKPILCLDSRHYWRKDEFKDKNFPENRRVGLIAQEVEKVLPEVVDTDNEGFKSVEYAKMVPLLIEAMKEQQKQIEHLKIQIKELMSQNQ